MEKGKGQKLPKCCSNGALHAIYTECESKQGMPDRPFHLSRVVLVAWERAVASRGGRGVCFFPVPQRNQVRVHDFWYGSQANRVAPLSGVPPLIMRGHVVCPHLGAPNSSPVESSQVQSCSRLAPVPMLATGLIARSNRVTGRSYFCSARRNMVDVSISGLVVWAPVMDGHS